jgi:hypothetical protein
LFDECAWNAPSTKGNGGAIFLSSETSTEISIIKCSFKNINVGTSSGGGSFYIMSISSVIISSSLFESLSASRISVGYINNIRKCVLFHNWKCFDCNSTVSYVGGLFLFFLFSSF